LTSNRLRITAGFFHAETGTYEVFWESRPFAWEPGSTITMATRHSVDVNRFCVDIWPGAPLAASKEGVGLQGKFAVHQPASGTDLPKAGRASLRLFMMPGAPQGKSAAKEEDSLSLPGLQIFSRDREGWVSGSLSKELPDGALELRGEDSRVWLVKPWEQVSLVRIPALTNGSIGISQASAGPFSMRTTLSQESQGNTQTSSVGVRSGTSATVSATSAGSSAAASWKAHGTIG